MPGKKTLDATTLNENKLADMLERFEANPLFAPGGHRSRKERVSDDPYQEAKLVAEKMVRFLRITLVHHQLRPDEVVYAMHHAWCVVVNDPASPITEEEFNQIAEKAYNDYSTLMMEKDDETR